MTTVSLFLLEIDSRCQRTESNHSCRHNVLFVNLGTMQLISTTLGALDLQHHFVSCNSERFPIDMRLHLIQFANNARVHGDKPSNPLSMEVRRGLVELEDIASRLWDQKLHYDLKQKLFEEICPKITRTLAQSIFGMGVECGQLRPTTTDDTLTPHYEVVTEQKGEDASMFTPSATNPFETPKKPKKPPVVPDAPRKLRPRQVRERSYHSD